MTKIIEFYVSVDIEANGPIPGPYSMSSIGAFITGAKKADGSYVTYPHDSETARTFYGELAPISENFVKEAIMVGLLEGFDTSINDPNGELRFQWMKDHGNDPTEVMRDFASFVNNAKTELGGKPVFTAYPASFDWTFVYWYFVNFGIESPFGFSNVLDVKSFYSGLNNTALTRSTKRFMSKSLFPELPHTHNALDDAVEQGVFFMNILNSRDK